MELKNNLTFKENLEILNQIASFTEDKDWDSDGMIYISVELNKTKTLLEKLFNDKSELEEYLEEFSETYIGDEEPSIVDICLLWGEICTKFNKDLWFNNKTNIFYVARLNHKLKAWYKIRIIKFANKIKNQKTSFRNKKFYKEELRKQKELKKLYLKIKDKTGQEPVIIGDKKSIEKLRGDREL